MQHGFVVAIGGRINLARLAAVNADPVRARKIGKMERLALVLLGAPMVTNLSAVFGVGKIGKIQLGNLSVLSIGKIGGKIFILLFFKVIRL
jgi:hypothetical protein